MTLTLPGRCAHCGAEAETKPYGPQGEHYCAPCVAADPERLARAMVRIGARSTN